VRAPARGSAALAALLAVPAGACGGGDGEVSEATYGPAAARVCFENAEHAVTTHAEGENRRLVVRQPGDSSGPGYATLVFTPSADAAEQALAGLPEPRDRRGNVALSGAGIGDDVVFQCLVEARGAR